MSSRDRIIDKLRRQMRDEAVFEPWQSRRAFDDRVSRFEASLKAAGGEVVRVPNWSQAVEAVGAVLEELNAQRIVVNSMDGEDARQLASRHGGMTWHVVGESTGDLRAFCVEADAGVSDCVVALAETGSVVVTSGAEQSRLATLLPPVHIVLVREERIVDDIFQWTAARSGELPANLTIVSGPSKTGDIGLTLVTGVHGPGRIFAVVYGNEG